MNFNIKLKTQNLRSFNLSTSLIAMQKKVSATTHENDDIIFLKNTQLGTKKSLVEKEDKETKKIQLRTFLEISLKMKKHWAKNLLKLKKKNLTNPLIWKNSKKL